MPLPFCVYILFSQKDLYLYIGFTTNIQNRLLSHNAGGTKSTSSRRPLELIFVSFIYLKKMLEIERCILKLPQEKGY